MQLVPWENAYFETDNSQGGKDFLVPFVLQALDSERHGGVDYGGDSSGVGRELEEIARDVVY